MSWIRNAYLIYSPEATPNMTLEEAREECRKFKEAFEEVNVKISSRLLEEALAKCKTPGEVEMLATVLEETDPHGGARDVDENLRNFEPEEFYEEEENEDLNLW